MNPKPFFITTPIYYINATPHIGHAYTQIAADARARFERSRGRAVYFLTGTDENAIKVARVAQAQGRDPQEFADELSQSFRDIWDRLGITYDDYIRTTEPRHRVVVQRVVEKLWQGGHLEIGTYSGWYSVPDETFFRAEECIEREGKYFIAHPTQDQSKEALEWVEEKGHFFRLSQFGPSLLDYYAAHPAMLQPDSRRNEALSFIRQGLHDTSISRVQDWGIPIPESVPEHENHVVYVWFPDALLNYASAPGYLSDDPQRRAFFAGIWPPDLHLMSKDIFTRFHTTLWPALLQAIELPLPTECFAHGFWTVDGRKMGKRDPATIVEPVAFAGQIAQWAGADFEIGVDALRYYCLREVAFGSDGDFSRAGCLNRYNSDLANGFGNLVNRTLSMLHQYCGGEVPAAQNELGLRALATQKLAGIAQSYEELAFQEVLVSIWEVVNAANRLIEEQKPWAQFKSGNTQSVADLLVELLSACQWCAVTLAPVMPHIARRLWRLLAIESELSWSCATNWDLLAEKHRCQAPQPLCPRINNLSSIEEFLMSEHSPIVPETPAFAAPILAAAAEAVAPIVANEATTTEAPASVTSTIAYEDFSKVELRTGKVLSAEKVPKADKLLKLQVDIGTEQRQILAGIAQEFEPESLVGKTVIVVTNLAPRKLRGLESQGMILAASTPDGPPLALVTVDAEVAAGCVVK